MLWAYARVKLQLMEAKLYVYVMVAHYSLFNWGVLSQMQVSQAGAPYYIPHPLWDVITCPCLWYVLTYFHHYRIRILLITQPCDDSAPTNYAGNICWQNYQVWIHLEEANIFIPVWCFMSFSIHCKWQRYHLSRYKAPNYKDKTIARPSHLYDGKPHTWKDNFCIETGTRTAWT